MIINAWAKTTCAIYGQLLFIHHVRACHVCTGHIYNACLYMSYIHPHIYLQGTLAHVLNLLYDQDTQELLDMLNSTPATPVTSPSETALPSAATSPTNKDTSQPGCGAVWGGLSLSLYYMYIYICVCICVCLFSLKGVFNTKTYIYIYLVKEHPGAGASGSSF